MMFGGYIGVGKVKRASILPASCQVHCFKYLGYSITHENEKSTAEKVANFNSAVGVINQVFEPSAIQDTIEISANLWQ
jgi:hypothetical protein